MQVRAGSRELLALQTRPLAFSCLENYFSFGGGMVSDHGTNGRDAAWNQKNEVSRRRFGSFHSHFLG